MRNRFFAQMLLAAAFTAGAVALPVVGDDKTKPAEKKPADAKKPTGEKAPDWSSFASAGTATGEVVKADEEGLTLRVVKAAAGGPAAATRAGGRNAKAATEDVDLKYADAGLVRWKKLPTKTGADGKKVNHTAKELEAAKKPSGAPGYAAERTDLQAGHQVEVQLVRPKTVPAAKATPSDLSVKYVVIVGESSIPPNPMDGGKKKDDPPAKKADDPAKKKDIK